MLTTYDGEWVSGDSGQPLQVALSNDDGPVDPGAALAITVRLRERATGRLVEGVGGRGTAAVPPLGRIEPVVIYNWTEGGADFAGEVEVECRLAQLGGSVTFPTRRPLLLYFRAPE